MWTLKWNGIPGGKHFPFSPLLTYGAVIKLLFFSLGYWVFHSPSFAENKRKKDLSFYLVPLPCDYAGCSARWVHGQVCSREKPHETLKGSAEGRLAVIPIECPEWYGWVEGRHEGVGAGIDYVCDKLVLVEKKAGSPRTLEIRSSNPFIDGWLFCQVEGIKGRAVALRSRRLNGQMLIEVFDLTNGKKIKVENELEASFGREPWEQLLREDVDFLPYIFYHGADSGRVGDYPVAASGLYDQAKKSTRIVLVLRSGKKIEMDNLGLCRDFKIARNGNVGWVKEPGGEKSWSYLEFYGREGIFLRIFGKYPQIQNWYFEKGGQGVVFSSIGPSQGPFYERYDLTLGKRIDYDEASRDQWLELKPWGKPIESEGKTTFWVSRLELISGKNSGKVNQEEPPWALQR